MTRQAKTPRQRAEEALAVADRLVSRLEKKRDELTTDLRVIERELVSQVARRDHLANHPDLPQTQQPDTNPTGAHTA